MVLKSIHHYYFLEFDSDQGCSEIEIEWHKITILDFDWKITQA